MKNLNADYSFLIGLEKTFFRVIIIAGPVIVTLLPEQWMNLTLGAAVTFLINFSKNAIINPNEKNGIKKTK